jgi:tripartite-type tricarboxylate transporter receptor subunit TctC
MHNRARRRVLETLAAGSLAGSFSLAARADAYPSRPIRWIVPYPVGGGSDFLARQAAPRMGRLLGTTIAVENRPGAAGIIGTELASRAAPDGYTLVFGDNGAMVFNPALYRKLPYSPADFEPVGFMANFPLILVADPASGIASARDMIARARAHPGKFSYASPGAGSPHHMGMELLKERAGLFIVHVPYRGTAMAIQDVMAGTVPMMIVDTAGGLAQIRAGKVKALAVLSKSRIPQLPDVPTIAEAGVRDAEVSAWLGLYVPKGTPGEIVARLNSEMRAALTEPDAKAALEKFGLQVAPSSPGELAEFVRRETAVWHKLIRERQLQLD